MNRSSFIKSIATIFAAPSLLTNLRPVPTPNKKYRTMHYAITQEMQDDSNLMEYIVFNPNSQLNLNAREAGIDLSEPFEMTAGLINNDFVNNIVTLQIKQEIK